MNENEEKTLIELTNDYIAGKGYGRYVTYNTLQRYIKFLRLKRRKR